ncbi:ABC transporter permease [Paenibacillus cymbidii]|uniref:ABC transporter permease n=1 Tax=Paenibacillus cymbidii TaxID=1639034 RepID=UPI0010808273|nr:ABC transporter permease subunit [Paenibacillus cymbidii]
MRGTRFGKRLLNNVIREYDLYLLILPVVAYFIIFHYVPMIGVQLAFKEFSPIHGIFGDQWVGLKYFERFIHAYDFNRIVANTVLISLYSLAIGFPAPIVLALMLNEVTSRRFKKLVQTVTYAPHFISTVVFVGMLIAFLSPSSGIINILLQKVGLAPIHFMQNPGYFKSIYVFSGIWQGVGWGAIIYIAALASVDTELYEAAKVDGITKLRKIWSIDLPSIMPIVTIMLVLQIGHIMDVGFEKVFLMQNSMNVSSSQIISTYVYNVGLVGVQYSYATAIGLFNAVINFALLLLANGLVKKMGRTGLW